MKPADGAETPRTQHSGAFAGAFWIWMPGEPAPRNTHVRFRTAFTLDSAPRSASLSISADSRYRLFVNGAEIGDGPARSFPHLQQYDTYDLASRLRKGVNIIACLVHHYGESTFQYVQGRGGLLLRLEGVSSDGSPFEVTTGRGWKSSVDPCRTARTPRISCQMPFEEQFDARLEEPWVRSGFDDRAWPDAVPIGPAGTEPWRSMQARTVEHLSRIPVSPFAFTGAGFVRPVSTVETVNVKRLLFPEDSTANRQEYRALICTVIESGEEQEALLPRQFSMYLGEWRLNGEPIEPPGKRGTTVRLRRGKNLFTAELIGENHEQYFTLALDAGTPVSLRAPFGDGAKWLLVGPLADDPDEARAEARTVGAQADLERFRPVFRFSVPELDEVEADVWNTVYSQRPVPGTPSITGAERLGLAGSPAADAVRLTVNPGAYDTSFTLDFGRELVGNTSFEADAPAGAVLDFYCFEALLDSEPQHMYGNRAAFRYVCREGLQRYVSELRRGYRYVSVTVRNASRPVTFTKLETVFSAYPADERGGFACSDPLLESIWNVGRHTLRCCMEDTFTDCPGYEQTYWVGDGRNEALVCFAAFGEWEYVRRCAELPAHSLYRSPVPESQVPSGWQNILPAWSMLWVQMVEEYYRYTGDLVFLESIYPAVERSLESFRTYLTPDTGLLSIRAWNLFDWARTDTNHELVAHNSLFLIEAFERAARIARALRDADGEARWSRYRRELAGAVNRFLWTEEGRGYIDSIHGDGTPSGSVSQPTNTLAVLYGAAEGERMRGIARYLTDPPEGMVRFGSPFAMFFLLEALGREGKHDELLSIVRERWGFMLEAGATTFWETFPGYEKDVPTRSHCHAWSSAPTYFLSLYQLGVSPEEPGFACVRIAPEPCGLSWARGTVPTPMGDVRVSWSRDERSFELEAELPHAMRGRLVLPVPAEEYAAPEAERLAPAGGPAAAGPECDGNASAGLRLTTEAGRYVLETECGGRFRLSARRA